MSADAVRKEFEVWAAGEDLCRDIDVENAIWEAWQAARSAAIQECADLVFDALLAGAANVTDKRDLFEFLQVTADNLRDGVLALKERG